MKETLEAEANYAKRIYEKLSNPTPELLDQMLENIRRGQLSKSASLLTSKDLKKADVDKAAEDLMGNI